MQFFIRLFIFVSFFLISLNPISAQKIQKLNSVTGIGGSSKTLHFQNKQYYIKQSIGQSGISGTLKSQNKVIIQGFIQPKITKANTPILNELEVLIEAIPFSNTYRLNLIDDMPTDYSVYMYNIMGQVIYSTKIQQSEEFEINLDSHAIGCYILCVQTNQKQFTTKLLKK